MYNNPYINTYNPQNSIDRINSQIAELEKMKTQIPQQVQPTNLTQNFQLAPNSYSAIKYANSMEDVTKSMVIAETPFFSNDMSVVWIKNTKNEIRTFELNEIIPKDEKDLQIEYLQLQIEELKKGIKENEHNGNINEPVESEKSTSISTISKPKAKSTKSTRDTKTNDK